jgi:hypothetical protein
VPTLRLAALPFLLLLVLSATARADWTKPVAVTPASPNAALLGLTAPGDVPAVLSTRRRGPGDDVLELRTATRARGPLGAPVTVATSDHGFEGVTGGSSALGGVFGGDRSAAWLQIIDGARRPVVATGPRLAHRQVLSSSPRSTQILSYAANRFGDAVVAFWRYAGTSSTSYEVLAAYRHHGEPFGPAQVVGTGAPSFPVVTIGQDDGAAAVGWSTPQGLQVAEHPVGSGDAFGPAATIPGTTQDGGSALSLAVGGDGRADAAWAQRGQPGAVSFAERPAGQTAWGAPAIISDGGAPVRASTAPGLVTDDGVSPRTYVAWTEAMAPWPAAHDVTRFAVRTGIGWQRPVAIDPGIRGRLTQVRLLAPQLGRLAQIVVSAYGARRIVTTTVRGDGTLGPRRTLTTPSPGTVGSPPIAAQGARSTWLAWGPLTRGGTDVLLARSVVP